MPDNEPSEEQPGPGGPGAGGPDPGGPDPGLPDSDGPGEGLHWSYELDLAELLWTLGITQLGDPADVAGPRALDDPDGHEISFAAERAVAEDAATTQRDLTGAIADQLPAGPGLAAWLAQVDPDRLTGRDLPVVAAAYRRLASWAQAGELAAVATVASRAAVRSEHVEVDEDGRPAQVTPEAAAEVSLALTMSQVGASYWTRLAVELRWRIAATGAALFAGTIDLPRARLICDALGVLDDDHARQAEAIVLPKAGDQTTGKLRIALRRAVIKVDPRGADERRENAERRAKVSLHPDEEGTAALVGSSLPGIHAAAAMARISALARAMKASGAGGGIDLLRAQVFIGLLLGTLPLIPPGPEGPPDEPPDDGDSPDPAGPGDSSSRGGPGDPPDPAQGGGGGRRSSPAGGSGSRGGAGSSGGGGGRRPGPARGSGGGTGGRDVDGSSGADRGSGGVGRSKGGTAAPRPAAGDVGRGEDGGGEDRRGDDGGGEGRDGGCEPGRSREEVGSRPNPRDVPRAEHRSVGDDGPGPPSDPVIAWPDAGPWRDAPILGDAELPDGDGGPGEGIVVESDDDDDSYDRPGVTTLGPWPPLPATTNQRPPVLGRPPPSRTGAGPPDSGREESCRTDADRADGDRDSDRADGDRADGRRAHGDQPNEGAHAGPARRPAPKLLDLTLSWDALTGGEAGAASLGRLGPVTASQARPLALLAAFDPHAQWRVILTDAAGRAIAVERVRRRVAHQPGRPGGVVGRVTVTMPVSIVEEWAGPGAASAPGQGILAAIWRTARRAAKRAERDRRADAAAGGCAHTAASPHYRPPPRIREYVEARDQTCRHSTCRQPAWRSDLDHTVPWDQGGRTCSCNIGGRCRTHHKIKQLPGWTLRQPRPGYFELTTPAGRTYVTEPDTYPS